MTPSAVEDFLRRHQRIALDTNVVIFEVEENPKYVDLVHPIFLWLLKPASRAVTSTITMLEVLVHPYRQGNEDRVNDFYSLLYTYPNLEWIAPTLNIVDTAARLRADHKLNTPHAIHAATALASGAHGFISKDAAFQRLHNLDVLILDEAA